MTAWVKPVSETEETVTLRRTDYEALLDSLEDAQDLAAVRVGRAHEARIGYENARENYLTAAESRRLLEGEHPVKVWREKRALSQRELAEASGVGSGYIGDIEARRKPGSIDALRHIAQALHTEIDWLVPTGVPKGAGPP